MTNPDCPRCAEGQARLEAALQERDAALLELARAREELNRRALAERWSGEEEPALYPLEAGVALPVPLRYRVADALHTWAKRTTPRGVQRWARALARRTHER